MARGWLTDPLPDLPRHDREHVYTRALAAACRCRSIARGVPSAQAGLCPSELPTSPRTSVHAGERSFSASNGEYRCFGMACMAGSGHEVVTTSITKRWTRNGYQTFNEAILLSGTTRFPIPNSKVSFIDQCGDSRCIPYEQHDALHQCCCSGHLPRLRRSRQLRFAAPSCLALHCGTLKLFYVCPPYPVWSGPRGGTTSAACAQH